MTDSSIPALYNRHWPKFEWPTIEMLYLDELHPGTPSHLWWQDRAYRIDPATWTRIPDLELNGDDYPAFNLGDLVLIDDGDPKMNNLTYLRLESAKIRYRAALAQARGELKKIADDL
ncbi:hypothetical protein SEA_FLAPPER_70 [Gordonia phage Flapper]|uniref:Uncharacterized protein n=1 Tax=Gordonia phage Flapper TaxID=2079415 RepID=A0A2L1IXG6_9CAUD|nr:hypothetical protein KNT82_gp70 [Gordonia phage Flapper]AVD99813.1 hypothetical protein SEA_FLAPPER_70 [Gordonia phage Flapper]